MNSRPERPMLTIAWDRDDVLNSLTRRWFEDAWKRTHPDCGLRFEQLTENPPHRLLGVGRNEYLDSLDAYRATTAFDRLVPEPEVIDWFQRNGHRHRHLVLTATTLASAPSAAAWVFRHFGRWIHAFHLLPASRADDAFQHDADKGERLRRIDEAAVLVDDSPDNLAAARREGVAGLLFPQPWNEAVGGPGEAMARLDDLLASLDAR